MVTPQGAAALRQFVEDELVRAPMLVDQVVDAAVEHIQAGMPGMTPHDRAVAGELMAKTRSHRQHVVDYYLRTLRDQIADDASRPAPAVAGPAFKLSLSLVDEDEVAVDVEISHTIETIKSVAEYELRELQTFTAALVGDMDVTRDHNPFRAETHARALWSAAQALPLAKGYQLMFMRHAAPALAQVLRKAYAAASSRLEAAGVEPASHRTLILPSGSRRSRVSPETTFNPDLERIRDTMPVREAPPAAPPIEQVLKQQAEELRSLPPETGAAEFDRLRDQQRQSLAVSAVPTQADPQAVELVSRLFDAILSDRSIAADVRFLLSRLQAPALRVAMRDPKTLDKDVHPVWLFADRLAFYSEILPPAGREGRTEPLAFAQGLVDHLVAEEEQTAGLYQWALERLQRYEAERMERRCQAAAAQIAQLQALDLRLAAASLGDGATTGGAALDLGQLDTVPAELIAEAGPRRPAAEARQWLEQQRAGDWVRMFMEGRWVYAQLLWPGEQGEVYLFGNGADNATWAVRRRALLTLWNEKLLGSLKPQSLVRVAAKRVMRQSVR
ncbi:MAG: DUF1631 family protein [Sphaerotilus natans]